jgi:hypothetical protein
MHVINILIKNYFLQLIYVFYFRESERNRYEEVVKVFSTKYAGV